MQSLDIISINIWTVLISLANLLILFLILKKFLFKPVKETLAKRQAEIDKQYEDAAKADEQAQRDRATWEEKLQQADTIADAMIKEAAQTAQFRGDKIVAEAKAEAEAIVRQAQTEAALEKKNAEAGIRREIVDLSTELAGKMLEREVKAEDHRRLIDSFLDDIGDAHD